MPTMVKTTINPPQPIPFIPMVPPLASTFSPPVIPSVTSALVDNLINNNPTPVSNMTMSTNTTNAQQSELKTSIAETNANVETSPASQLFNTQQNPTQAFLNSEQQQQQSQQIAPPTSLPEHLIPSAPPASVINQSFVNTEGRLFST